MILLSRPAVMLQQQALVSSTIIDDFSLRPVEPIDIPRLVQLEERCFTCDRISARSFRHFVTRANAAMAIGELGGKLAGYVLVLFHRGSPRARLYSLAVDPEARGRGLGAAMLRAAESLAARRGAGTLRLEVRADNPAGIALYRSHGYREFGHLTAFYEDGMDALRFEKPL